MNATITCPCGLYSSFPVVSLDEAQNKARARQWKYIRLEENQRDDANLWLEGVCPECTELGDED